MNIQNLPADDKEERNPRKIPTKYNIQMALRWLVEGSKSGDSLVFHYSGYDIQEMNMNEIDHKLTPHGIRALLYRNDTKIIKSL
jgi:hypothetical protein